MAVYSPIEATYGERVTQLLESASDYAKYHAKLNRKLRKLRHRCGVVTRDTKKYSSKEKYSTLTADDYDHKTKLVAVLVLLHAERDMALTETYLLRARQRGQFKNAEKKLMATRLKKVHKTSQRLLDLSQNEKQWATRAQYLIFAKLAYVEYLLHGKQSKRKESENISRELALSFIALQHLNSIGMISNEVVAHIQSKYEYNLKIHAGNLLNTIDLQNFMTQQAIDNKSDELVNLLLANGYEPILQDISITDTKSSLTEIQWRSFTAKINDLQVAESIENARSQNINGLSDYDAALLNWQEALKRQEHFMDKDEQALQEDADEENEQILLAYIKFNILLVSISRDKFLIGILYKQWTLNKKSMSFYITKFKDIQRLVKNLTKFLQDMMDLPGVYSDDTLMSQLELCITYYQCLLNSNCLAEIYRRKGKYMEALAIHVHCHTQLNSKLDDLPKNLSKFLTMDKLLTEREVRQLQSQIKTSWSNIVALAEYKQYMATTSCHPKYQLSVIEALNSNTVELKPIGIKLDNLFPMRPKLKPVGSKPTLFDLAFNYIDYEEGSSTTPKVTNVDINVDEPAVEHSQAPQKRGFLGLFKR